jgi:hypothetical protein
LLPHDDGSPEIMKEPVVTAAAWRKLRRLSSFEPDDGEVMERVLDSGCCVRAALLVRVFPSGGTCAVVSDPGHDLQQDGNGKMTNLLRHAPSKMLLDHKRS